MGLADKVVLDVANRRRLGVDVTRAVLGAEFEGSMELAPQLTVPINDPHGNLMGSRVMVRRAERAVGSPEAFALRPIDLLVDGTWYRLQSARREGDTVALGFLHRGAAYMMEHDEPMSASRNAITRALFIRRQVLAVGRRRTAPHRLGFWAPHLRKRMPIAAPDVDLSSRAEPDRDLSALSERVKQGRGVTVKGVKADAEQRRNMAIALEEADATQAPPKATLAQQVAAIGESAYRNVPNSAGSPYGGVWQGRKDRKLSTREQARYFLIGGKGFQAGGAIKAAREHPDWTVGQIATAVEASGKPAAFYDQYRREGLRIIDAMQGASADPGEGGSYVKAYTYRRERGESGWDCTRRLAEEVDRRRFITVPRPGMDTFVYAGDQELLTMLPSQLTIVPRGPVAPDWDYDLDYGKTVRSCTITVLAPDAGIAWGLPITLRDAEAATGKWLVWSVQYADGSPEVELELRQPQAAKPEPAAEVVQRSDPNDAEIAGSGTASVKAYSAASRISERNLPYVWGGGHATAGRPDGGTGRDPGVGYDCSGYVAACLLAGDMLPEEWKNGVPASGTFASSWGEAGKGEHLTVWANGEHIFIEFHLSGKRGRWADTSRAAGGGPGPHLRYGTRSTAGFTARHWPSG